MLGNKLLRRISHGIALKILKFIDLKQHKKLLCCFSFSKTEDRFCALNIYPFYFLPLQSNKFLASLLIFIPLKERWIIHNKNTQFEF